MTSSDIIAIAKPWPVQYQIAFCIYDEFFAQGTAQHENFGIEPVGMEDVKQAEYIPKFQMGFIWFGRGQNKWVQSLFVDFSYYPRVSLTSPHRRHLLPSLQNPSLNVQSMQYRYLNGQR